MKLSMGLPLKLLLLAGISVLLIFLFFNPLTSICEKQHEQLLSLIQAQNPNPKFDEVISHLKSVQENNKDRDILQELQILSHCPQLDEIKQEIRALTPCNEQTILSAFEKLEISSKHEEILSKIQQISTTQSDIFYRIEHIDLLNSTDLLKTFEILKKTLKDQDYAKEIKELQNMQKDEVRATMKMMRGELRSGFGDMHTVLHRIENVKALIATNSLPLDKFDIKDMKEVLGSRNEKKLAIYFTETTGTGVMKPRFVCAVESAAKAYPQADIYVLFAYLPIGELLVSLNEALYMVVKHHPNVHILKINLDGLFKNSPLDEFYFSGKLNSSRYLAGHSSDMIRTLVLYQYGGYYFDLDIITVRNLSGAKNFIIDESALPNNYIANGCVGLEKGSVIAEYMFDVVNKDFNGEEWQYNGPRVLTSAMRKYTGVETAALMNEGNLKDFIKLKYETLFPIEYFELMLYFDEEASDVTMARLANVTDLFGFHIGNNLINNEVVRVGSKQPYSLIAQEFCPRAYWSAYEEF